MNSLWTWRNWISSFSFPLDIRAITRRSFNSFITNERIFHSFSLQIYVFPSCLRHFFASHIPCHLRVIWACHFTTDPTNITHCRVRYSIQVSTTDFLLFVPRLPSKKSSVCLPFPLKVHLAPSVLSAQKDSRRLLRWYGRIPIDNWLIRDCHSVRELIQPAIRY